MTALAFDTLKVSKDLRKLGFDDKQAEGLSSLLNEVVVTDLATKEDLNNAISSLEQKLTIRIGGMIVLAVAVIQALAKFT
tara:strand:+ start:121 stop:360 length:240 start_codon:yes stop_codon:yes gene_type:complete